MVNSPIPNGETPTQVRGISTLSMPCVRGSILRRLRQLLPPLHYQSRRNKHPQAHESDEANRHCREVLPPGVRPGPPLRTDGAPSPDRLEGERG